VKHQKTKCKSKLRTKTKECIVTTKRSCSYKEEVEELKGLVDLKKKAKTMKKVTMTIATLASYTQEKTKRSKTMGGKHQKTNASQNQEQNHKNM
jgi:hypothetical protein